MTYIALILSLGLGYMLGREHYLSHQIKDWTGKIGGYRPLIPKEKKLGVVLPMSQEEVALRKDPIKYKQDKEGEEIFDEILQPQKELKPHD